MVDLRTQSKSVDFTGATATKPFKSGTALPSTCGVGEMFNLLNAPPGANIYGCMATNTWTIESGAILPTVTGNSGKILSTDGNSYIWTNLGGDVTGLLGTETVVQIQGHPVSSAAPSSGQSLIWNSGANQWQPQTPSITIGGDLSGSTNSATVVQIQGHPVSSTAPSSGQSLIWNSSANQWQPQAPSTTIGGDLSGSTSSATVVQIQGHPVSSAAPSSGQHLIWNSSANQWQPQTASMTTGGDLSGPTNSATVVQIQGHPVSSSTPASGQSLMWNSGSNQWQPQTPSVMTGGDLSGLASSATVVQIQGRPVSSSAPASGQVLAWNSSVSQWQPQTVSGGGGGGGATVASQLGDFQVTRTNSTVLTIGANCSPSTPCNVRFGSVTYSYTSPATATVSGGTGMAYFYIANAGSLTIGTSLTVAGSGGVATAAGVSSFPTDSIPIFSWSATNGTWDSQGGVDQRAFLSSKDIQPGVGLTTTDNMGHTLVAADTNYISLRTAAPATSSSSCTMGAWATDGTYYYLCVSQNTWKRVALTTF
jgi:hypothetical protein